MSLYEEFKKECKDYYEKIVGDFLSEEEIKAIFDRVEDKCNPEENIAPTSDKVFEALRLTKFQDIKVVILGQDPYPYTARATGLAFDPGDGTIPASLKNIMKEIFGHDVKVENGKKVRLTSWANQGVLLLNTALTVKEGTPKSHIGVGWEELTHAIIKAVDKYSRCNKKKVVFMFWGESACMVGVKNLFSVYNKYRMTLAATHPSDRSKNSESKWVQAFSGCNHFDKANGFLDKDKIDWKKDLIK